METNKLLWRNPVINVKSWFSICSRIMTGKKIVKSIFVIGLLIIYSMTAIGVTVHFHYCMDRFAGWSLFDQEDQKCLKCGMHEHKDGCCKDVHKHLKLSEDHQKASYALKPIILDQGYSIPIVLEGQSFDPCMVLPIRISPDPPLLFRPRLHLQHCVFLI